MPNDIATSAGILGFWFEELTPPRWWRKDPALDRLIAERFGVTLAAAKVAELYAWRETPQQPRLRATPLRDHRALRALPSSQRDYRPRVDTGGTRIPATARVGVLMIYGLFEGKRMGDRALAGHVPGNTLTFNPGRDSIASNPRELADIDELQRQSREKGRDALGRGG